MKNLAWHAEPRVLATDCLPPRVKYFLYGMPLLFPPPPRPPPHRTWPQPQPLESQKAHRTTASRRVREKPDAHSSLAARPSLSTPARRGGEVQLETCAQVPASPDTAAPARRGFPSTAVCTSNSLSLLRYLDVSGLNLVVETGLAWARASEPTSRVETQRKGGENSQWLDEV